MPVTRRRAPGKQGGRPVERSFGFAPSAQNLYPSESEAIRRNRLPADPNQLPSWSWALDKMQREDCWLVIRINGTTDEGRKLDINRARAAIHRTASRRGMKVTTEYVKPELYVGLVGEGA